MKLKSLKNIEIINQNLMIEINGGTMYMQSDSTDVVCKSGDSVSEDYGSACGDCVSND
jgi:hypothetical protein